MDYEKIPTIPKKSVIHFKEYTLDRHERKSLSKEVDGVLFTIITPEQSLDEDLIKTYYPDLEREYYPMVSVQPYYRIVLEVGTTRLGIPVYHTLHLNKYYMMVGVQELEWEQNTIEIQSVIPTPVLGFNSYEIGEKFKK